MKKILFFATLLIFGFVACSDENEPSISVTNVTLTPATLELIVGDYATLTVTIEPVNADNQQKTWTSSNNNIASVDANGRVTLHTSGTATITVTTEDGTHTANSTVYTITPTFDRGVVINGIRWATRNVNAPGTFAARPEDAGMFFQWNSAIGWSSTDPLRAWLSGTSDWAETTPDLLTWSQLQGDEWYAENDPCPSGWRVPTVDDLRSLSEVSGLWTQRNGVNGRLFGTAPYQVFFPAAGFRNTDGRLSHATYSGFFWSGSQVREAGAWDLTIGNGIVYPIDVNGITLGLSVRCVAEN
jgi:uncharacterized protein (TIGR02145 family)